MATRINKYLAEHGIASRRKADQMIEEGKIKINGRKAKLGDMVSIHDTVSIGGRSIGKKPKKTYLLFHKPVGLITTTDTSMPDNVISYLQYPERIFPVGRLDVASSGLLLLTNDGDTGEALMHPRFEHEKEYIVEVDKPINDQDLKRLSKGIELEDGKTLPAKIKRLGDARFSLTLKEGRNRQIRRMCETIGYEVTSLKRIRILMLKLDDLKPGQYRKLKNKEVKLLIKRLFKKRKDRPETGY